MIPDKIDLTISYGILAFLAAGVCRLFGLVVSIPMLIGLGAMSGSFDNWRTERGLWMLGLLFLLIFGGFYVIITYHQVAGWIAGRAPLAGRICIDWIIATSVLTLKIRFLWGVTYWNRRISREK